MLAQGHHNGRNECTLKATGQKKVKPDQLLKMAYSDSGYDKTGMHLCCSRIVECERKGGNEKLILALNYGVNKMNNTGR